MDIGNPWFGPSGWNRFSALLFVGAVELEKVMTFKVVGELSGGTCDLCAGISDRKTASELCGIARSQLVHRNLFSDYPITGIRVVEVTE